MQQIAIPVTFPEDGKRKQTRRYSGQCLAGWDKIISPLYFRALEMFQLTCAGSGGSQSRSPLKKQELMRF